MANLTFRTTTTPTVPTSTTASAVPLTNDQVDGNFRSLNDNKAEVSHKYHQFSNGQYFFDDYEQGRYLRLFTENSVADIVRFNAVQDIEYWDQVGSNWVAWGATGLARVKALLDGRQDTAAPIDHANRKFRFTVTSSSAYPSLTLVVLQSSWSAISYTTATVTIETSATVSGGTWTLRDTSVFSSANTGNNWGTHLKATNALHVGESYYRVTIDLVDWVDSTTYTTYPLRNFGIFSNYGNGRTMPFSWNYDKIINFEAIPSAASVSLVTTSDTQTLSNKTITGTKETRVAMAANNIDLALGNFFTKTISGATTLSVTNIPATGTSISFILDLTNGGAFTISWWTNVKWAAGTAPTLTASGRDVLGFFTHDNGSTWTGLLLGKDVK